MSEATLPRSQRIAVARRSAGRVALLLAACAWRWAALRAEEAGGVARPGRLATGMSIAAFLVWALPLSDLLSTERTGGAVFYGVLIGLVGAAVLGILALGLVLHLTIVRPIGERWIWNADSMTTAGAWTLLLFLLPAFTVLVGVRGTDTTIWC